MVRVGAFVHGEPVLMRGDRDGDGTYALIDEYDESSGSYTVRLVSDGSYRCFVMDDELTSALREIRG